MKKALFTLLLPLMAFSVLFAQSNKPKSGKQLPKYIDLNSNARVTQTQDLFKEYLQTTQDDDLKPVTTLQDELGFTHQKFQQYYKDVKVDYATYTVHSKAGMVSTMTGDFLNISDLSTSPSLSVAQAFANAINHVGAQHYMWEANGVSNHVEYTLPAGELVVVGDFEGKEAARLAYKFDIYASEPLSRSYVYIDAHNGEFIRENERIHHANVAASGASLYNGTVSFTAENVGPYRLRQTADGNGIQTFDLNNSTNYNNAVDITSSSTVFSGNATGVQAHWGAEKTHKYYLQNHGRNSYNGSGAIIKSYVSYSNNYVNAYWDGSRMTYGDGDGVNYGPLVSLDIVGHEITHGVTEYSANLAYQRESGALNESFSDVFGEAIENFATGSNNWQMGTDIGIGGSGAIRSMNNPNAYGDPDTYGGSYWQTPNCGTPTQNNDYCGVHTNSGVQNKWFYILSVGESGTNDIGSSYSVTGIGITKAAAIAYRNLTVYLSSNSTYAAARSGAIQAARDLYGVDSAEEIATTNAWYAVGVGSSYGPPPPVTCVGTTVSLSLTLDNYPSETTWNLKNSSGATVASGGPYSTAGSTVNQTFSLTAGDYTFTINDSYGDGICCSYGNGSYTLVSGGTTIVSGGAFGSSAITNFCVEGGSPIYGCMDPSAHNYDPAATADDGSCETCSDGIQNGDETGVDCGGSLCAPCGGGGGTTVLLGSYFESGWDGWSDGGSDCARVNSSNSWEGNYSIQLRDNSGTASAMTTSSSYNLTGYSSVEIKLYFKAISMENGEDFWVRYYNGSSWSTVAAYAAGTSFSNNTFYSATVTLANGAVTFPTNAQFRIQCDASNNSDYIYVDEVTITATSGSGFMADNATNTQTIEELGSVAELPNMGFNTTVDAPLEVSLFPNPATTELNIASNKFEEIQGVRMFAANGSLVKQIRMLDKQTLDISNLQPGIYFLSIETTTGVINRKFVKQ